MSAGILELADAMNASVERMIAVQMTAYPSHWSDEDRREMAEQHLKLSPSNASVQS